MGQLEVLQLLKKNKDQWFESKELARCLKNSSLQSIRISIKKLKKSKLVEHKKILMPVKATNNSTRNQAIIVIKHKKNMS